MDLISPSDPSPRPRPQRRRASLGRRLWAGAAGIAALALLGGAVSLLHSSGGAVAAAQARQLVLARGYHLQEVHVVHADRAWLSPNQVRLAGDWSKELGRVSNLRQARALAASSRQRLRGTLEAVARSQAAAAALVSLPATATTLPQRAAAAVQLAGQEGLSPLGVPQGLAALADTPGAGATAASSTLQGEVEELLAELGLAQELGALRMTTMGLVDQAALESVPTAPRLLGAYTAAKTAMARARTPLELVSAQGLLGRLQRQAGAALAHDQCGHSQIQGKSIYISLALQEMVFYQAGCAVRATAVTSGRPGMSTPTGTFSVFLKRSPLWFYSGDAPGTPGYYVPFQAQYGMEFLGGGYYIHNAPWETPEEFGPGSQDDLAAASHGCVHTPLATLAWAYGWTPLGTPVVISA
ncbi:MAG: L,D-transpeptidase [Candidatus Dormibacteria bacterium]